MSENNEKKPEDSVELYVDELEEASGGYILNEGAAGGSFPYAVVNDKTGEMYASTNSLDIAKTVADYRKVSPEMIGQARYDQLFGE